MAVEAAAADTREAASAADIPAAGEALAADRAAVRAAAQAADRADQAAAFIPHHPAHVVPLLPSRADMLIRAARRLIPAAEISTILQAAAFSNDREKNETV